MIIKEQSALSDCDDRKNSTTSRKQHEYNEVCRRIDAESKPIRDEIGLGNARSSSRPAFETEALPHYNSLYRFALHLSRNTHDAQDLVQETYFQACRYWHSYKKGTNCGAWLHQILKNRFINLTRATSRSGYHLDIDELDDSVVGELQSADFVSTRPDHEMMRLTMDDTLTVAFRELPDKFRETAELFFHSGLSYAEIADMLGVHIGTVKSRIYRGRLLLKDTILDMSKTPKYSDTNVGHFQSCLEAYSCKISGFAA